MNIVEHTPNAQTNRINKTRRSKTDRKGERMLNLSFFKLSFIFFIVGFAIGLAFPFSQSPTFFENPGYAIGSAFVVAIFLSLVGLALSLLSYFYNLLNKKLNNSKVMPDTWETHINCSTCNNLIFRDSIQCKSCGSTVKPN
jgi:hypothetical protein